MDETARQPKVLLAADFYAPHWTGVVKSFVNLADKLIEAYRRKDELLQAFPAVQQKFDLACLKDDALTLFRGKRASKLDV